MRLGENSNVPALRARMQRGYHRPHLLEGRVIFAARQAKPGFVRVALPLE
jgi:hypothetical protein